MPESLKNCPYFVLLLAMLLLIASYPLATHPEYWWALVIYRATFLGVIAALMYLASNHHRQLLGVLLLAIPLTVLNFFPETHLVLTAKLICFIAICIYAMGRVMVHLLLEKRVADADAYSAAACGFLLLGVMWSALYHLALLFHPGAFMSDVFSAQLQWHDLIYYSFVTLTTLGYGDIVPVTATTRALSILEAIIGVLYSTILIARLATLYGIPLQKPTA